jgi:hypothetical protein
VPATTAPGSETPPRDPFAPYVCCAPAMCRFVS